MLRWLYSIRGMLGENTKNAVILPEVRMYDMYYGYCDGGDRPVCNESAGIYLVED